VHRGRVFVAMELLTGGTLRDWLAGRPPWPRVLEALLEAGRGLAAAHRHGIVHRDFKPDNVLVSADGRMLVSDFGLAWAPSGDASVDETEPHATRDAGTPAYMAPEQFAREGASAKSDQFSFCVTAWEALYGQRPYGGASLVELATAVTRGDRPARFVSFGPSSFPALVRKKFDLP